MCARKSKAKSKKLSKVDTTGSNTSDTNQLSPSTASNPSVPSPDPPNACGPRVILCPQILKVADKDVEVGERSSIQRDYKTTMQCEQRRECEDSEELRRRAFQLYKQYLEQKKCSPRLPPNICPPDPCNQANRCYDDESDDGCYDPSFNIFLVIVFLILLVMLSITSGFIYVVLKTDWLKSTIREYALYFIVPALFIIFLMNCTMACSACSRVLPCNFLYLLFAVACMSIVLSVITVLLSNTSLVLIIYASTAIVVAFFILLAYSPFDFTKWLLYVIAILLALVSVWGLLTVGKRYLHETYGPAQLFLAIICSVMNVVILVIELQLLLSGRSIDLDESEYATGAYLLYTAILELCFNLIQATGMLEETEKDDYRYTCN